MLRDFPSPSVARTLSPNGRAHWATKKRVKGVVREHLWEALAQTRPRPVRPPVSVLYRWVVPDRKHRDDDNHHGSGVIKHIQDLLVREGLFPGGDHSAALTSRVEIVYERGQRRLEIELAPADARGHGEEDDR